jgi:hypothetical protein
MTNSESNSAYGRGRGVYGRGRDAVIGVPGEYYFLLDMLS